MLETNEKIRLLLKRKGLTVTSLAESICTTRQNLTNKLNRNNFSEKELREIAKALNSSLVLEFEDIESKERI
jgi:transcriptional regulator with XRE-family HTH domain